MVDSKENYKFDQGVKGLTKNRLGECLKIHSNVRLCGVKNLYFNLNNQEDTLGINEETEPYHIFLITVHS